MGKFHNPLRHKISSILAVHLCKPQEIWSGFSGFSDQKGFFIFFCPHCIVSPAAIIWLRAPCAPHVFPGSLLLDDVLAALCVLPVLGALDVLVLLGVDHLPQLTSEQLTGLHARALACPHSEYFALWSVWQIFDTSHFKWYYKSPSARSYSEYSGHSFQGSIMQMLNISPLWIISRILIPHKCNVATC